MGTVAATHVIRCCYFAAVVRSDQIGVRVLLRQTAAVIRCALRRLRGRLRCGGPPFDLDVYRLLSLHEHLTRSGFVEATDVLAVNLNHITLHALKYFGVCLKCIEVKLAYREPLSSLHGQLLRRDRGGRGSKRRKEGQVGGVISL